MPQDAIGGGTTQETAATATESTQSQPVTLTDDTLVTYEGAKEPVKFSTYRGLQSQFTKVSQEAAELKRKTAEYERSLSARAQERHAPAQTPTQADFLSTLRDLPYLSGQEADRVVQRIGQEFQRRDQVLLALATKLQQAEGRLGTVYGEHAQGQFKNKIQTFLTDLNLDPEEYAEEAEIFYLAHEGENLDQDFPRLFKNFLDKRASVRKAKEAKRLQEARTKPFIPGKGGQGSAQKPLDFAGKSAAEQADMLWPLMDGGKD